MDGTHHSHFELQQKTKRKWKETNEVVERRENKIKEIKIIPNNSNNIKAVEVIIRPKNNNGQPTEHTVDEKWSMKPYRMARGFKIGNIYI